MYLKIIYLNKFLVFTFKKLFLFIFIKIYVQVREMKKNDIWKVRK